MSASRNFIVEGFDPTSGAGVPSNSQLLQMVHAAGPASDIGFVIVNESTPDVVTYPELENFIWYKPSAKEAYGYNGTSWELVKANVTIPSKSILIGQLSGTGGTVGQVLAVNATQDGFEFKSLLSLIATGALPITKLTPGANDTILTTSSLGVVGFLSYSDFATAFFSGLTGDIPVDAIVPGTTGQMLYTNLSAVATWGTPSDALPNGSVPLKKLQSSTTVVNSVSGTVTVDASLGDSFKISLMEATVVVIANLREGQSIQIRVKQHASSTYAVSAWQDETPTAVKWPSNVPPVITTTANHSTLVSITNNGGDLLGAFLNDYYV